MDGLVNADEWNADELWVTFDGQVSEEGSSKFPDGSLPKYLWNDEGIKAAHGLAIDTARFAARAVGKQAAVQAAREFTALEDSSIREKALAVQETMWEVIRNLATDMEAREAAYQAVAEAKSAWQAECRRIEIARRTSISSNRQEAQAAEHIAQTSIVRDLIGNPFRTVSIDPACLSWNHGTIQKIAQAIYHERQYDNFSVLSDALHQAECTNQDILIHCQHPGPHFRGCWVVDLLLGKE